MSFVEYQRPCVTKTVRDNFAAHVARGSVLPGLDYACATGDRVFAAGNGVVEQTDFAPNDARGVSIIIRHPDGRHTHYLHLSAIRVKQGQRVRGGSLIALSGNTGTTTTGAHLHFSIQDKSGRCIDPARFLAQNAREARKRKRQQRLRKLFNWKG